MLDYSVDNVPCLPSEVRDVGFFVAAGSVGDSIQIALRSFHNRLITLDEAMAVITEIQPGNDDSVAGARLAALCWLRSFQS